jgi:hypothetical protein
MALRNNYLHHMETLMEVKDRWVSTEDLDLKWHASQMFIISLKIREFIYSVQRKQIKIGI